ncbi:MAG: hypothetical protein IKN15_03825 [Bacteroidaceae bacterium]|nr:hypothetical protein [Bacteroidaceae bacterium]
MKRIKTNYLQAGHLQRVRGLLRGMFLSLLLLMLVPAAAWADDELGTVMLDGTSYYVLRSNDDWMEFKQLVLDAKGAKDVNALLDADLSIANSIALESGSPYRGIFNGNGHTLNVNIKGGDSYYIAPFSLVKNATIKNLHVTGTVNGGIHASGLIGSSDGTNYINNCWVSVTVNCASTHVGGFVGHGQRAKHVIDNCYFDGTLISAKGGSDSHGGSIIGWEEGGTSNEVTHCLENGNYTNIRHAGMNYNKSIPWGGGSTNWSYHDWGEMNGNVVGSRTAAELVNLLGSRNWHVVDGKAVPVFEEYPSEDDVSVEAYDAVPGTEEGDEGSVRIPVTSTSPILYVDATYTDAGGNRQALPRTTLEKNTYYCFLRLPATEKVTDLTITVKLEVGQRTVTVDKVPMIHSPRMLKADVDSVGGVKLQWKALDREMEDLMDGDIFKVQRSLTGKVEDFENLESDVMYDSKTENYLYRDSTLISSLTAAHIDKNLGIPLVRYRVLRATTEQLWGMDKNPTVAYVQPQFATLELMKPKDVTAAWSDLNEHKAKVTWKWTENDNSHNYVWDDRAEMKIVTKMYNKAGQFVDSLVTVLTDEQYRKREAELTLNRSCVTYDMRFIVDGSKSPIGKGEGEIFTLIKSNDEYVAYKSSYNANQLTSYQNAILATNVTVATNSAMLGEGSHPFTHNFNGNGYTLTYENTWAGSWRGIIQHAADGAVVTNLQTKGRFYHDCKYAASLVAHVQQGSVFIENCYSQTTLQALSYIYNTLSGGLVGLVGTSSDGKTASLYVSNSWYAGDFTGGGEVSGIVGWREDNSFAKVSNSYYSGIVESERENATIMYSSGSNPFWNIVDDCSYKKRSGVIQGKNSDTAPDNWCWKNGMPDMKQVTFSTPVSGSVADVKLPTDKFYYENLGHIDKKSLKTTTLQSSVLLEWKLEGEDAMDYFEVWRREVNGKDSICIATQLSVMEYEDKNVSAIRNYEYKVRGVNDCEGRQYEDTKWVPGHCVQTGLVEGYVRFSDGTGVPGVTVSAVPDGKTTATTGGTAVTDERGYYCIDGLPYWNKTTGAYNITTNQTGGETRTVEFDGNCNLYSDKNFTITSSVKFSGFVMYEGTSIPVQNVSFKVDGKEVKNASGPVKTDFEGKFSFRMVPGKKHTIQAFKDGHEFWQNGYYMNGTETNVLFSNDKADVYFYDKTKVTLIGRVAGGKDQGDLPLANSLSKNNLGDELKMVFVLEGDNTSRLVFDITDRSKKEHDTIYVHKAHDKKFNYHTRVHTTPYRMEVTPDVHTGEYMVKLPPVKWKIQQITAQGYATLFQEGQTGDVIDLTDSIKSHTDHYMGEWKAADNKTVTSVDVTYNAIYNRIYRSPVLLERKQQGFDKFDYFGEKAYSMRTLTGEKQQIQVAYPVTTKNQKTGVETTTTHYTFGYPVFSTDRNYSIKLSAVERYCYNNNVHSDTVDVVKLEGGFVNIYNGFANGAQRDTLRLDENGEGIYTMHPTELPYLLTGKDALSTVTFTMERDGATIEGEPLKGYVFTQRAKQGAKDILSIKRPVLVDILRDPPGGGSTAKLSKGSTLKLAYQMDMAWKGGLSFGISAGSGQNFYTGVWAGVGGGANYGQVGTTSGVFNTSIDLVFSGTGQRAFAYTMTANEDITTSSAATMVGAEADVYMGMETNLFVRPTIAIQAVNDSVFRVNAGARAAGRMLEIAQGRDENDSLIHLVRTEVIGLGQEVTSTFVHSQQYILKQLIPQLVKQCRELMFTGSEAEAKQLANDTQEPVYWSLREPDDDKFAMMNTAKNVNMGDDSWSWVYNTTIKKAQEGINYLIVLPNGYKGAEEDKVKDYCETILTWANMVARNEKEKITATNKMKNFDIDGGGGVSYSEDFSTEYSNTSSYNWFGTDFTHNYFANTDPNNPEGYTAGDAVATAAIDIGVLLGNTVGKFLAGLLSKNMAIDKTSLDTFAQTNTSPLAEWEIKFVGLTWKFGLTPVAAFGITPKSNETTKYSRKESFDIKMDKKSHLDVDVYYSTMIDSRDETTITNGKLDVFVEENFLNNVDYMEYFIDRNVGSRNIVRDMIQPRGFIYRTRGGATVQPWEPERKTHFYSTGSVLDERTKRIENPVIKMDKQSVSGVPFDEPARFKVYLTNDSEQPEAIGGMLFYWTFYLDDKTNPKGAKVMCDGMPLTTAGMTVRLVPGEVTEKTIEVWATEDFDYEDLTLGLLSMGDIDTYAEVSFSVHFLREAGSIAISSPGDKWIMNTDAPYDSIRGWYMPVIISNFNKNQHNFDHIELQYKESTRGDDYWTNLCGFYKDKDLYNAASGTKEMIPENGYINTRFYGDGKEMEKGYDLRAVLFCRNGNDFVTNSSAVLTGVKDTRRPQLFGTSDPKDGILGPGDNIIFNFSEEIEHNYLSHVTNFEVVGETNETSIQEEPSMLFGGSGFAASQARRNFTDKNVSIDVMVKPDKTGQDMPIFSHGTDGHSLQLWVTKDKKLKAVVNDKTLVSDKIIDFDYFNQVVMVLDNSAKKLYLYNDSLIGSMDNVTYSGYGTLIFGSTNQSDVNKRSYYKGRMLEARVWNRVLDQTLINTYGKRLLTGYEMGLIDYYPMNDGEGQVAIDLGTSSADLTLTGASWALPRGMSLHLNKAENRSVKGLQLQSDFMARTSEQDYTLMFWFKTDRNGRGALLSNGSGKATDVNATERFFIGFEDETLKYRSNGEEYKLGDNYSDDTWHHYAMTVNRSRQVCNIYVDNVLKASFMTDKLGGMTGNNFFLGNMVWQEEGKTPEQKHYDHALTGNIDELCLFKQALPTTLIKRYSKKSPRGSETGLITYLGFNHQERTKQNELLLFPYALNQVITIDEDGIEHVSNDSVFVNPISEVMSHIDQTLGAPVQPYQELKNLNFSFVGRNNQLLVNIDELDKKINKRTVYVTVTDIPDKNGNYMASPATESFFVNRNPLTWETNKVENLSWIGYPGYIYLYFNNNSGSSHTYTIENLPPWLTLEKCSDIIGPQEQDYVLCTFSKDMNVGSYDQVIYLTDENGLSEPLTLEITIEGDYPEWEVSQDLKRYSMNIVAQVSIGDAIVTNSKDIVAAFDKDGNCMGKANVEYDTETGLSMVYMTVYNNTNEAIPLYFRLWHYDTGKTMLLTSPDEIKFGDQTFVGTVKEPVIMTANDMYIQHLDLKAGWNWISFNVKNPAFENVSTLLNLFEWEEADIVTEDSNDLTLAYKNGQWMSNTDTDISKVSLSTALSYRVKTQNDISIDFYGESLKEPKDRLIHVKEGWNSIGYTPLMNLPVATALAEYWSFAKDGDIIKSQDEFAQFYEGADGATAWMGSLKYMKPGEGYMLYRQKKGEVTFYYPYYEPGSTFIDNSGLSQRRSIAYRSTMTVVAKAIGVDVEEGDKLVAYAGGEVVGECVVSDPVDDIEQLFFLSINGDRETPLSFTIERDGNIIATSGEAMDYQPDSISGSLRMPTKIDFTVMHHSDFNMDNGWYSVQGIKLSERPTQHGVYIHNGKKQIIK